MRHRPKPLQSQLGTTRQGVSNEIFALLLQEITSGDLPAGSRLPPERELAEHFGVSQPTVREAVRALDATGLVDVRHGSGAYVTGDSGTLLNMALSTLLHLESVSILDLLEIRSILGTYSARRAATYATVENVERTRQLVDLLADSAKLTRVDQFPEAVAEFAEAISEASHNPLLQALESFVIRLMMQLQFSSRPRTLRSWRSFTDRFVSDRADILSALADRDEERLVRAMDAYIAHQQAEFADDAELSAARISQGGLFRGGPLT